jgi:hypothetical protein
MFPLSHGAFGEVQSLKKMREEGMNSDFFKSYFVRLK